MSRLSTIRSFHAVEVAVALGSSTQSALAADACDVPVSVRTEAISAGALGQGLHPGFAADPLERGVKQRFFLNFHSQIGL